MGKFDLRNLGLFVVTALAVENGLGSVRIVHNETDGAVALLVRELLICKDVDAFFGEGLAEFAKCSRPVLQADCEFPCGRHVA
jgi:hypothetical protein